jgi:EVE domain
MSNTTRYWINTISKDHLQVGINGGFTQANHGKITRLKGLKRGDWMIFYSPKTSLEHGEPFKPLLPSGKLVTMNPTAFK